MMRCLVPLILITLIATACNSGSGATATTTTFPTTTTISPQAAAAELCDQLKIAAFDVQAGVREAVGPALDFETLSEQPEVDEEQATADLADAIAGFYTRLGELAPTAPADLAGDLETLGAEAGALREALIGAETSGEELEDLSALVPAAMSEAGNRVEEWVTAECDTEIAIDPQTVLLTTVFQLMGEALAGMGEAFGEALEESFSGIGEELGDGGIPATDALGYGSDAALDELWDECGGGSGGACDQLFSRSPLGSEYEAFAQTCGGVIPLRDGFELSCEVKLGGGETTELDALAASCLEGDLDACDALYLAAPVGSEDEATALTCGGARPEASPAPCSFHASGDPYTYGDDPALDALWDACAGGDAQACSDLYFGTAFDSAYEAFGQVCGNLLEAGADCTRLEGFLTGS